MKILVTLLLLFSLSFAQSSKVLTEDMRVEIMQWASPIRSKTNLNPQAEILKKNIVRMLDILMLLEKQKEDKQLIIDLLQKLKKLNVKDINE